MSKLCWNMVAMKYESWREKGNDNDIVDQPKKPVSRLGWRFKVFWSDGDIKLKEMSHKTNVGDLITEWHGFLNLPSLIAYLENLGLEDILLHMEYNVSGCKIYGNPLKP